MKAHATQTHTAQGGPVAATSDHSEAAAGGATLGETSIQSSALQIQLSQSPRMLAQRRAMRAALGPALPSTPAESHPNQTGMPNRLKAGIESLSGLDMSSVRVHRHSNKPAQLKAFAYAQGSDIHLGPGQEHHLPHEAWHVVQQRQGRVRPTVQMAGVGVNDDAGLEREADAMGRKAMLPATTTATATAATTPKQDTVSTPPAIQRARWLFMDDEWVNPDTLDPIDDGLNPPVGALEGDVWDDVTLEHTTVAARMGAIFAGTSNRAPPLNLPTSEEFREQLDNLGKPNLEQRVKNALDDVPTEELSKETILAALEKHFRNYKPGLHAATRDPLFSETLLEGIRQRQSKKWVKATRLHQVSPKTWVNHELQHWNVRHYTSKLNIVLGDDLGEGIFTVAGVDAPPFNEILSTVTLATMKPGGGGIQNARHSGDRMLMTYTGGAASSGHTTGLDWANVGNVGDTFYGLFYKDKPATGITPPFITDAVYYATWSVEEFGVGWASADWLGTAAHSQEEDGETPDDIARTGELSDIIASIFPEAAMRDFSQTGGVEPPESEEQRKKAFQKMSNFEIKKHGPMPVNAWIPVNANINKTRTWWVDTTKGKFVKLKLLLPQSVRDKL